MCACEPGYTCSRCKGTPQDDAYHDCEPVTREEWREQLAFDLATFPYRAIVAWYEGASRAH